jgi:uncharacterized protein
MHYLAVRQFALTLRNLSAIMDKARAFAETRKFDVNNFCGMRLFPDMLPFMAQIRIACDHAKNAACNLAGVIPPPHEDSEVTFDDLRGRINKCLGVLDAFTERDYAGTSPDTVIKLPRPAGKGLRADDYLLGRQIPNFFFHVTTAYNILRAGGVDIGKTDYLGPLNLVDA